MDVVSINLSLLDWLIIFCYIGLMIGIGLYIFKKVPGFDNFFSAGRAVTAPLLVATLVSTFYGLDTLFGTAEIGFMEGIVALVAYSIPFYIMFGVMAFLAPKIRDRNPNARTMIDILGDTYGKGTRLFSAVTSFFYSTNTMEMMGMGFVFSLILGIPFEWGVILGAAIALIYTALGGLLADILTDFVQFFLMVITLGIATLIAWNSVGGASGVWSGLALFNRGDPSAYFHPLGGYLTFGLIIVYSITSLAALADPAFFQRIFASASGKEIRKGFLIGIPLWLAYDICIVLMGMAAAASVGLGIIPEPHADQSLLAVMGHFLPSGLIGLFIAGVMAASMSTADSYFLVGGGNLVYDIYRPVFRPKIEEKKLTRYVKYGIIISAAVSIGLVFVFGRIMGVWVFQASLLINSVLFPMYMALFYRGRKTKLAGLLSTGFGLIATVVYYILISTLGYFSTEYGTYMLDLNLFGTPFTIWQEYAVFFIFPIGVILWFIGNWVSKEGRGVSKERRSK